MFKRRMRLSNMPQRHMATILVSSSQGDTEEVSELNFRTWKKKVGHDKAFVTDGPDEAIVSTMEELGALPAGRLTAQLCEKVKLGRHVRKGAEAWRPI